MDYYQGVVYDYLRADRTLFLNAECCIQVHEGQNPDRTGPHWYCDAVVVDFRRKQVLLCEISYSSGLIDLLKRLKGWNDNWEGVRNGLLRDSKVPDWPIRPWVFIPEGLKPILQKGLDRIGSDKPLNFEVKVTALEETSPWKYCSWNRCDTTV